MEGKDNKFQICWIKDTALKKPHWTTSNWLSKRRIPYHLNESTRLKSKQWPSNRTSRSLSTGQSKRSKNSQLFQVSSSNKFTSGTGIKGIGWRSTIWIGSCRRRLRRNIILNLPRDWRSIRTPTFVLESSSQISSNGTSSN